MIAFLYAVLRTIYQSFHPRRIPRWVKYQLGEFENKKEYHKWYFRKYQNIESIEGVYSSS